MEGVTGSIAPSATFYLQQGCGRRESRKQSPVPFLTKSDEDSVCCDEG